MTYTPFYCVISSCFLNLFYDFNIKPVFFRLNIFYCLSGGGGENKTSNVCGSLGLKKVPKNHFSTKTHKIHHVKKRPTRYKKHQNDPILIKIILPLLKTI